MILEKRIPIKYLLSISRVDLLRIIPLSIVLTVVTEAYDINFDIPFSIPALLGTAISLVLSFKLSQSYDRWWEARKIWGAIVNDSRNLVIQLKSFCRLEEQGLIAVIAHRQIAWCYSLEQHLRQSDNLDILTTHLISSDQQTVMVALHKPLALSDLSGNDFKKLHEEKVVNSYQQIKLFNTLEKLVDSMGQAERIKNTVFPKLYRLFLKLFIYTYIFTLALALGEMEFYYQVPLLIGLSMPFLMLEKTALLLQDPFGNRPNDTAMTTICSGIESNIKELLNEPQVPAEPTVRDGYFVL